MSHFTQLKTQLRDLAHLTQALEDLGLPYEQGSVTIRGYRGATRDAQVVLRQENHHDLGFAWNGQSYEFLADLQYWQQPWPVERFLSKIQQRYAYHAILSTCTEKGFQLASQEASHDGSVRLVLQRWGA